MGSLLKKEIFTLGLSWAALHGYFPEGLPMLSGSSIAEKNVKLQSLCDVTLSESCIRVLDGRRLIGQRRIQKPRKAE